MLDRVYVLSLGWRLLFCFFSPKSIKVHKILHFTLSLSSTAIYCPLATITAITAMTIPFHSDTKQDLYRGHKFLRRRRCAMRVKRYICMSLFRFLCISLSLPQWPHNKDIILRRNLCIIIPTTIDEASKLLLPIFVESTELYSLTKRNQHNICHTNW